MAKVTIQVDVPDEYVDSFKKHVEEIARFLRNKERLKENLEKVKGILKTDKSWEELKEEYYEAHVGRHLHHSRVSKGQSRGR